MTLEIYIPEQSSNLSPFFPVPVPAGAAIAIEQEAEWINIDRYLCQGMDHVVYIKASGLSMKTKDENRIDDGDILVVRRSDSAQPGDVVIAEINGEFTVKRLKNHAHGLYLVPANDDYPIREVVRSDTFAVWGVVVFVIHKFERRAA